MDTFRRKLIDGFLREQEPLLCGRVLDLGGKKFNRRGKWRPTPHASRTWEYLNLDPETRPDYLCSAELTFLEAATFDAVVVCELLEHVANPDFVLGEVRRLLRAGGRGIVTMPFLNQVHADPGDYQRWTAQKIVNVLEENGLEVTRVQPNGSVFAVVFDLFMASLSRAGSSPGRRRITHLLRLCLGATLPVWRYFDLLAEPIAPWITTGWSVLFRAPVGKSTLEDS
jgi:SAM-dependent methyltransferase